MDKAAQRVCKPHDGEVAAADMAHLVSEYRRKLAPVQVSDDSVGKRDGVLSPVPTEKAFIIRLGM
jgi:hypothetical protein